MDWLPLASSVTDERTTWIVYGMIALSVAYLVLRPMLRKRRDPLERSAPLQSLARQRAVERQMETLLVELSQMATQITSQLDTRAAKLEALIREADERITAAGRGGFVHTTRATRPEETPPDPRHAEVYALADQGRAAADIAHQLNRPSGEVELILALRPQISSPSSSESQGPIG
jgi:C4-dicarboxylate-specific signal transduction histidine kinase